MTATAITGTGATRIRYGAAALWVAPVVLLAGLLYHPFLARLASNPEAVGAAAAADPTRWGVAHMTTAAASGLIALAFMALRAGLRDAGEERFSAPALPLVVAGSVLYAVLPGIEMAALAVAETGGDVAAAQAAIQPWFLPVFVSGAILFGLGALWFARAVLHSGILDRGTGRLVAGALIVMALARFVPLGVVQFHVQGLAAVVALWPLARWMGTRPAS